MIRFYIKGFLLFCISFSLNLFSEDNLEESNKILYEKLSTLEKEVALLRSIIEENSFSIERYQELNQQRYLDLDKRLHDLLSKELVEKTQIEAAQETISINQELSLYKESLEYFDKARYSEALESFRELIINYPEGDYSADAYFWSGELYLAQNSLEDARQNFLVVTNKYSNHQRSPDSLFKLGVISYKLDETEEAIYYFNKVIELFPNSGSAQLAKKNIENLQK